MPEIVGRSLQVLCEDDDILAVSKPAAVPVRSHHADETDLYLQVREYLALSRPGGFVGLVHRIDKPASGLVLFAKTPDAANHLARQFRDRQVQKTYWAIVAEKPTPAAGTLIDWLCCSRRKQKTRVVSEPSPSTLESVLSYRTLDPISFGWLLEIDLVTGRYHQIRAQLAAHGLPIVGDALYGGSSADRLYLHSRRMRFTHPGSHRLDTVTSPWQFGARAC